MTPSYPRTAPIIVLACVSMMGIFGLLIASGVWEGLFFLLAALPLILGVGAVVIQRRKST